MTNKISTFSNGKIIGATALRFYTRCPRVATCTRVAFGQSHHCLLGKPSIAHRLPVRLFVTPLQHFISPEYRHASHPACRKYHHCSRYCKSTNGIITLSLCNQSRLRVSRCGRPLHCSQVVLRDEPEAKCKEFSVQHADPLGRSLCALVCGL
jgi:hypothetical protein